MAHSSAAARGSSTSAAARGSSTSAAALRVPAESELEHRRIAVGPDADGRQVALHVVLAGPETGTPVILLHGFPEFWWSWRYQIAPLVEAGYRVIAPDMRGYNTSDKPSAVRAYRMANLISDVAGLVHALGYTKTHLVAHDWGGAIAWGVAALRPDVVDRLVILNAPHPTLFSRELRNPSQLKKSWYMFFFQLPRLPERRLREHETIARTFRGWTHRREHFDDATIERYVEAIRQPGAATATVNYYRAALREVASRSSVPVITRPTMVIWGMDDRALGPELIVGLEPYVPGVRIERIEDASHWVAQDAPEKVNALLLDFLR